MEKITMKSKRVSILMESWDKATELSRLFQQVEVLPTFCENLSELWRTLDREKPDLILVDIRKMSEGSLSLGDHPRMKGMAPQLVFFYENKDAPLLLTCHHIPHLGLIRGDLPLAGQLKSVLDRFNDRENLLASLKEEKKRDQKIEVKAERFREEVGSLKEKLYYQNLFHFSLDQLELFQDEMNFEIAIKKYLEHFKEVKKFAIYQFSVDKKKLISYPKTADKMRSLPTIWLGKTEIKGSELAYEKLMTEAAVDRLDGEVLLFSLRSANNEKALYLFLQVENDLIENFPWDKLEWSLNGLLNHYETRDGHALVKDDVLMTHYDLFSLMDLDVSGSIGEKGLMFERDGKRFIHGDFSNLVDLFLSNTERVPWKTMFDELMRMLKIRSQVPYQLCLLNAENYIFVVDKLKSDQFFQSLKIETSRFPFWKYLDDKNFVLADQMKPQFEYIPADKSHLLKLMGMGETTMRPKSLHEKRDILLGPLI